MNPLNTHLQAIGQSTCQKRIVVCKLVDAGGKIVALESNRCDPEGGMCHRKGIVQERDTYALTSECNWTHAEIMAINSLPEGAEPRTAHIFGHDFACQSCTDALEAVGVTKIECYPITTITQE